MDQIGYFSKRNAPDFDAVWFVGHVYKCKCALLLFRPQDKNLRPQIVEEEFI